MRPFLLFVSSLASLTLSGCSSSLVIEWHEDGVTKYSQGRSANGERSGRYGLWTFWYENGNKWMEGRYEEGEREGAWTWWYENGNKSQFGAFMGGQRNSPFTYWYANGMKSQEVTFVNGERNGLEITWYEGEQGKNSRERRFRDGKQYGGDAWKVLAEN